MDSVGYGDEPSLSTAADKRKLRKEALKVRKRTVRETPRIQKSKKKNAAKPGADGEEKDDARVLRSRELAMNARQKRKALMERLESDISIMHQRVHELENENSNLVWQVAHLFKRKCAPYRQNGVG